jgi:hypothetical protein
MTIALTCKWCDGALALRFPELALVFSALTIGRHPLFYRGKPIWISGASSLIRLVTVRPQIEIAPPGPSPWLEAPGF